MDKASVTIQSPGPRVKGSGFDPETGGFAKLLCDGIEVDTRQVVALPQLLSALERANRVLAELAHSNFIPGADYGSVDVRQRIRSAHAAAYLAIAKSTGSAA